MLTKRQINILDIILNNPEGITGGDLSQRIGVSSRTIRNEISEITVSEPDIKICASKKKGYFIPVEEEKKIRQRISCESAEPAENEVRSYVLLGKLLRGKKEDTYELAEEMNLSQPTILKELAKLKSEIKATANADLIKVASDKAWTEADEKKIRQTVFTMAENAVQINYTEPVNVVKLLLGEDYDQREFDILLYQIQNYFKGAGVKLSDSSLMLILQAVIFSIERNFRGFRTASSGEGEISGNSDVKRFLSYLGELGLGLTEGDFEVLAPLLHTLKLSVREELNEEIDNLSRTVLEEFLKEIMDKYDFDLHSSDKLYENMLIHIEYMMRRAQTGYEIRNPIMDDIKETYPFAYEIAMLIVPIIYHYRRIYIKDDEVAYIAVFIEHYIDNINVKLKTVIINSNRNSINSIICGWIKNNFSNYIEITDTIPAYSLPEYLEKNPTDLIISTSAVNAETDAARFVIEKLPDLRAAEALKGVIKKLRIDTRYKNIVKKYFSPEHVFIFREETSFEEVIYHISAEFERAGIIENPVEFANDILLREINYPTVIGKNMMMPHPLMTFSKKTKVGAAVLKKPIKRNGNEISLIMTFSIEANLNSEVGILFKLLNNTALKKGAVKTLCGAESGEEFIKLLLTVTDAQSRM